MVLCRGASQPGREGLPPIHHHLPDQAVSVAGHALSQHVAILDGGDVAPPILASAAVWAGLPEATGPPPRDASSFYPTGPPSALI
jgi:hypothetical protein